MLGLRGLGGDGQGMASSPKALLVSQVAVAALPVGSRQAPFGILKKNQKIFSKSVISFKVVWELTVKGLHRQSIGVCFLNDLAIVWL